MTPEEVNELENIAIGGLLRKVTPDHIESMFLQKGYIRRVTGGLMVTEIGHKAYVEHQQYEKK